MTNIILQPSTQDSNIYEGSKNNNYNYSDRIEVGESEDGVWRWMGWIKWDMSAIPSGAKINSAEIRLYLGTWNIGANPTVFLNRVTSAWTETQPTWNNTPSITSTRMSTIVVVRSVGWKTWPLDLDEAALMLTANYGVRIFHEGLHSGKLKFRPREYGTVAQRPILEIDYEVGVVSMPITKGLIRSKMPNIEVSKTRTEV